MLVGMCHRLRGHHCQLHTKNHRLHVNHSLMHVSAYGLLAKCCR